MHSIKSIPLLLSPLCLGLIMGCSGGDSYGTVREAATAIGDAFCTRADECSAPAAGATCVDEFVSAICQEGDCSAMPLGSDSDIDDCVDAMSDHPCEADVLPAECNGVL